MRNPHLAHALTKALSSPGPDQPKERRIVLLGVGSELRSDDAAGVLVAQRVGALGWPDVWTFLAGTAPENLTGDIKRLSPSHVIIVDAADMHCPPGTVSLLGPEETRGVSFSTHTLPLSVLAGYLETETGCVVIILGIQPLSLEFADAVSAEVLQAVEETVTALALCLGQGSRARRADGPTQAHEADS